MVLCLLALQVFGAGSALAQACSDFGGVLDGDAGDIAPATLEIDQDCTIQNYSGVPGISTDLSFAATTDTWLVVFDNVAHSGTMTCGVSDDHDIWFVNSTSTSIETDCADLLVPVEAASISNPPGLTSATIGVPFTYRLTLPQLFDPATGNTIDATGSANDLQNVVLTQNLSDSGAALSYVSHTVTWAGSGLPIAHSFTDVGGLLTFDGFPPIPAGEQIVIEMTVVPDNSPANINGTPFFGTANWEFGRLVGGSLYVPLPGQSGVSAPLTIGEPDLVLRKLGPPFLNLGEFGTFVLDVINIGETPAWEATIDDVLPLETGTPVGGMCDTTPAIQSAQVYQSDGVTPVPGKGALSVGTDLTVSYTGAPTCQLQINVLTAAGAIGAGERLIIEYETALDANTENGLSLTNVAGVTQWFNADSGVATRETYTRVLTDGTSGTLSLDHEDSHTVVAALSGSFFNKTVSNVSTAESPATTASPGDTLRYDLHVRTTDAALDVIQIVDDLGSLNPTPVFQPGTLSWVAASLPPGADVSSTDPNGGSNGTGLLDVRNLSLPAGSELLLQFEIDLAPILPNGIYATNQATLTAAGAVLIYSDDPEVNGQASPDVADDDDPTQLPISSAPYFDVDKISTYLDGDTTALLAAERIRYTITVANNGTDNATDAYIRDQIPANTTYVADSTTLNGLPVADLAGGVAPLSEGFPINAAGQSDSGAIPAGSAVTPDDIATITFDVLVDADVVDGTIISNQAFVGAAAGGVTDQPSDDPRTEVLDDPTRDVVGNLPLLFAEKSAALEVDFGTTDVVDAGDTLRYTITVYNNGSIPATQIILTDEVPTNTTYVADSLTINGEAYGADDGDSPLVNGIAISSTDLTPPLPVDVEGTLTQGESAVIQFDVVVDAGTPPGTLIVNQATVESYELQPLLSDGDGDPSTGPEPTVVVVGPYQQLAIAKQVAVVGGGPAYAGSTLEYTVRVRNIAQVPASFVEIYDDLDVPTPGYLTFVPDSATLNGSADGIVIAGSLLTADYSGVYGELQPDDEIVLRFQAVIDPNLTLGTVVTNTADVQWNDPPQTESATVSVTVGGLPGAGVLSGTAWHDEDFDDVLDAAERELEGWEVALYQRGELLHTTFTDENGFFRISGVGPATLTENRYELRFNAPGAGPNTAALGRTFSDFDNGLQVISDIPVEPGANLLDLNLPIDPNGVVYNTVARAPLPGATLTMVDALTRSALPTECFDDPQQQDQVTLGSGFYKFDINFSDVACPEGADYLIEVSPPPSGNWIPGPSELVPPSSSQDTPAFSVPDCLQGAVADAIPATTLYCEVTDSALAPVSFVGTASAANAYYLHLTLDNTSNPGSRQIFNNHIAVDPDLRDSISITKSSPVLTVRRGDLVPYLITVTNDVGFDLSQVNIVDRYPVGFRYVEGSARLDGVAAEPTLVGGELVWDDLAISGAGTREIELLFAVGSGVSEGDFVNRAQVVSQLTGNAASSEATATVRLVPDPDFDCTDVMGKVFDDENRNGTQDDGERGIPGVRLVTANGLAATTDAYGRYHVTCATVPNENRGSNFVVKLDDRTLPSGFRASGNAVQIARATRGKALRFNFGASIHRVVGIDLSDPVFIAGSVELRPQWRARIDLLMEQLVSQPAILRISYLADLEDPALVDDRVRSFEREIRTRWGQSGEYELDIEPEVFWRRGAPVNLPSEARRGDQ